MFINRSGFLGFRPPLFDFGLDFGWRRMVGWRDTYVQNVNLAGWMLGGWGNAIVDTDPWRLGRRFLDDVSGWLGLPLLPPPNFTNPFSLSIYDPMRQSAQIYVGAPAGGSPGYSPSPAGETRAAPPAGDGGDEKPLTEAERMEKALETEEAVRKKMKDKKEAKDKAEADKASAAAKAKKAAAAARGKAAAKKTTTTTSAVVQGIIKNSKQSWPILSLTKVTVPGRSDKIYKVPSVLDPVLCNSGSGLAVTVKITGTQVDTVDRNFGACDATKIYKK